MSDQIPQLVTTAFGSEEFKDLEHEYSRFARWSRNTGALALVIRLLNPINRLLEDAASIAAGDKVPWDQIDDDGASSSDEEDDILDENPNTEIEQITMHIAELIESLSYLGAAARNPAPHDRINNPILTHMSHFEPFDIQHVSSKYPAIDSDIAERLGKAISARRQYFKYRETKHARITSEGGQQKHSDTNTIVSPVPEGFENRLGSKELALQGNDSNEGISETSCATSAAGPKARQIPWPNGANQGGAFECPYCCMIIAVSSRAAWKKHVFDGLRPYICLEKECTTPNRQYSHANIG
ncbi:hypothetical protein FSARC_7956 [Fusarium sarcochroum]|uniref:Oxidoreductase acuF-like C2H2 type zinc-finger domain-containing protein n=1 Tax=Fusarium sarcochroum TaxID=1208366 RepID=A0A8H4X7R8_9HYPO|nr:hypothetical protein FSARC_7956 [Fusarium sarcochroum]